MSKQSPPENTPPPFDSALFEIMAEESPNMVFVNKNGRVAYANKQCQKVMEYTKDELSAPTFDFLRLMAPESRGLIRENYTKHMNGLEVLPYEYRLVTKTGKTLDALITTKLINYDGGRAILGIITDVTPYKNLEKALRDSEQKYRTTIDALGDPIHVVDSALRIVLMNNAFNQLNESIGIRGSLIGKTVQEAYPFLNRSVEEEYRKVFSTEKVLITQEVNDIGGRTMYTETRKIPLWENGILTHVVTVMRDITELKKREKELIELNSELTESNQELRVLSVTDSHTGVYNHRYLTELLEKEFSRAKRDGSSLSLIMLDIDYFKSINDVYGHQFGDLVLRQFAAQIKSVVRKYNSVIRYGGEEFMVISPNTSRAHALRLAQRLMERITIHSFGNKKTGIRLKMSIGVASYPEDNVAKAIDLIDIADFVLGKAKEFGGNRVYSTLDIKDLGHRHGKKHHGKIGIKYLKEKIERLGKRANQSLIEAVFAFARTIELKDHYTGEHVERTVHFATRIAEKLGLSKDEIILIKQASILHDLGKVGISEKILQKPSKLSPREFKAIKDHPVIGADIIRPIHLLHRIVPLVMYHHERWDGKGYPMGLKAKEIPIGARIIALADTYQALISNRPYRKAYPQKEALQIIEKGSASHFDPDIVKIFLTIISKGRPRTRTVK